MMMMIQSNVLYWWYLQCTARVEQLRQRASEGAEVLRNALEGPCAWQGAKGNNVGISKRKPRERRDYFHEDKTTRKG